MKVVKPTDPSAIVVPFGKHKGATVAELLAKDSAYADWIMAQSWVAERFAELHAALATRGAGTDDTPEHNALQARFLDESLRQAVLRLCRPNLLARSRRDAAENANWKLRDELYAAGQRVESARHRDEWVNFGSEASPEADKKRKETAADLAAAVRQAGQLKELWDNLPLDIWRLTTSVTFEQSGVDVSLTWEWVADKIGQQLEVKIELKPSVGDDFPTVMRQMKRVGAHILVIGEYHGRGVSEPQLRQMFKASGFDLVFVQEIEEEMRRHTGP